ncbi:MAG: argininosuccinate lyase [Candidatus Bathyarchaeia archaeon]
MSEILAGGRITSTRKDVVKFISSIKSDERIKDSVILINQAHVIMLDEEKIMGHNEASKLIGALEEIKNKLKLDTPSVEDIHVLVEEEVAKKIGYEAAGNLHIAKSRNDQVSTAIRIELRKALTELMLSILGLQKSMLDLAKRHLNTLIIGYTHLQPAQPTTFSHYIISIIDSLMRDLERFYQLYNRMNQCPMGACALATTSFKINRERVAELLGFDRVLENSLDAVTSRDFVLEALSNLAIMAISLCRLVEDLILWSSYEFRLVEIPDEFSSTSSIMPQKKNPDVLEVIRARMSSLIGHFVSAITILKGLPSSYNLDFQEITPFLWNSIETSLDCNRMLSALLPNLKVNQEGIIEKIGKSFIMATEFANVLTRKYKIPFRKSHKIVGALAKELIEKDLEISKISPEALNKAVNEELKRSVKIDYRDIKSALDPKKFIELHKALGGPSPPMVKAMIINRNTKILEFQKMIEDEKLRLEKALKNLNKIIATYRSGD